MEINKDLNWHVFNKLDSFLLTHKHKNRQNCWR